jgi:hypothetical protein
MKAYVATTGVAFGLITAAHIWRAIEEGSHVLTDPWFLLTTAVAVALSVWAGVVLRRSPRS